MRSIWRWSSGIPRDPARERQHGQTKKRPIQTGDRLCSIALCSSVYKPGSVCIPEGCRATIYLRVPSPKRFAACAARHPMSLAEVGPTRLAASYGVASDRVYSKSMLPWKWVSSYLAFPSLPSEDGGLFLLPFSGGYPRLTLSATLPYDARTFLTGIPFGMNPRGRPTKLPRYYTTFPL